MKYTILLASYNRLELLKKSLNSALGQTYEDFEVLVVDDGSMEHTKAFLQSLDNQNIRVIFQQNKGVAAARQNGLKAAKGDYIIILDSDDQLIEEALNIYDQYLDDYPSVEVVYCNNLEYKLDSEKVFYSDYPSFNDNAKFIDSILKRPRVPFKHSGMLFKRNMALELGGYDLSLPNKIDIDLMLNFLSSGKNVKLLPKYLVKFHIHSDSISYERLKGLPAWFLIIDRYASNNKLYLKLLRVGLEFSKYIYSGFFIRR